MNKAKLKSYAPQARQDFIAAVTARANLLGLSDKAGQLQVAPAQTQGDVTLIAGQAWPAKVATQRDQLITRMRREGFAHTCEAVAYTWFNRFAALRYMELHDYLGHGHRALSSSMGNLPDILTHAAELAQSTSLGAESGLPGLKPALVTEMKLAGNRDGELYRMLLVAQCNALSVAMPFLFERIDDDTELLLPDNLLRTDSVIAKLVQAIPEEDWAEVEIIGWLYQFYISEKKDQVIGKVVKSEDIPAATQLFTPNWIVQYLVQNSVGRLWLMANPASLLASQWPYYIQPASQTPEVQAQLDALIQTRMDEDGGSLNPETITVLDPACGSGHILVVAYDVLKAIYLERGYQPRAIPRLILEKNLYGLDIDDRAAQMAGFALLMKARADDRRLFNEPPKLNVLSLQESKGLDAAALVQAINAGGTERVDVAQLRWLIDTFEHAKTFGSLIQIGQQPSSNLRELLSIVQQYLQTGDLYAQAAAQDVLPLVQQALVLGMQFDAVVANPPYMGRKFVEPSLKAFLVRHYSDFDGDVFSAFMVRNITFAKDAGFLGFMSPMVWMFISSHEPLRRKIIEDTNLASLVHLEYNASGEVRVPLCTFTLMRSHVASYAGSYIRLTEFGGYDNQGPKTLEAISNPNCGWFFVSRPDDFNKIPGSPVAYWIGDKIRELFVSNPSMGEMCEPRQGLATADNDRFLRMWSEVSFNGIAFNIESRNSALQSQRRWFPHLKGGDFRKWYGNHEWLVDWKEDGHDIRNFKDSSGKVKSRPQGTDYYFKNCVSWSDVTSSSNSFRFDGPGFIPNVVAPVIFESKADLRIFLLAGNNCFYNFIAKVLNPTLHFHVGYFATMPFPEKLKNMDLSLADKLVSLSKDDWDSFETSWNFKANALASFAESSKLSEAWDSWSAISQHRVLGTKKLEEENNSLFINAYNLHSELTPEVPESQITLARADREKDCQRLISYAIGCMMGRYSLDEPGLIYAHAGNVGFDTSRYATFPADADGIVPLTDELWFTDDAASRVREFLLAVWGADTLEENMAWLAESLGKKSTSGASETPDETIRRYLADKFFKDHLQTYKKRPIYWLFSSGKQGAFQALVYLHRYTEGTLARLRAEYVVPLTGKLQARIAMLQKDQEAASTTAGRNKLNKEIEKLKKKHVELLTYDEQLRHYADMRITLDLDDGVKVNYGKFGDLLDSVKAVTGGAGDE
ncbi:BREX-1 system adenine-specific DNA-methyltransferase PglX [Polaromonas sp. CG_9.11]|uniref:BREX-1 system adenine-specific DNA-methyltransferase PglX n=1 Tax=Polaromonas sp. CG_9.11 TaxID=2787730 RepID=UPI0018CA9C35|nr:BREX-1 system adenine-specific DNA-methyltransferase PglX [Polaromonas sp. CG_9.11]MBG6075364.1 type II restriction/modification system DNA methylase subunit YeeA [Polaromonas sp. CG_9.11]